MNSQRTNGEEPEGYSVILLEDCYVNALLGNSISPLEPPRAVYSLPLLSQLEAKRRGTDEQTAQASVIALMREIYKAHGDRSPIFVDDSIKRPTPRPPKEKSRIIVPGRFGR